MRLHRFYISQVIGDKKSLDIDSPELVNQVHKVLRLKTGDMLIAFDGSGLDYTCTIADFRGDTMVLSVIEKNKSRFMPAREITLCAAIVKKDTFEWIVEKATELGVSCIVPIVAERSEKKSLNEDRLKKIALEASEQSGRGSVPVIDIIIDLDQALKKFAGQRVAVFHTEGESFNSNSTQVDVAFIGPEGGWSPKEIEMFQQNNFPIYSLGSQVLRAETAVVAALSKLLLN